MAKRKGCKDRSTLCPACGEIRTLLKIRQVLHLEPGVDVVKAVEEMVTKHKTT